MNRTIVYQFLDADARRAAREYVVSQLADLKRPRNVAWLAAAMLLFAFTLWRPSHWIWRVLLGAGPVLLLATLMLFGFMLWWMPRAAARKLQHLPHRTVEVAFGPEKLTVRSATEYMEVLWSELRELLVLPSFLVVRLKGGADLPFPRTALGPDGEAELRALTQRLGAPVKDAEGAGS